MNSQGHILIVDDDAELVRVLLDLLSPLGLDCTAVGTALAALAAIQHNRFDLVLLDRCLPGASGDDVLRQIRSHPRTASLPVMMLTALADEREMLEGFALGADDYLAKPFHTRILVARVAALLRSRRAEAALSRTA